MTYEYHEKEVMNHKLCACCKKPYEHWFKTTIYCGDCEFSGRANEARKKPHDYRKKNVLL